MPLRLTIDMDDHGNIGLDGPIDHPLECYGLLELGRQAVQEYQRQKAKHQGIQLAPAIPGLKSS